MKKTLFTLFILLMNVGFIYAQLNLRTGNILNTHKLILSEGVGTSIGFTDYEDYEFGYNLKVAGEYYFKNFDNNYFGGKISANITEISGSDNSIKPSSFITDILNLNFGLLYGIRYLDDFYPYASFGLAVIYFDPRDSNKNKLPNNSANKYDKLTTDYFIETGVKYRLSQNFLVYGELTLYSNNEGLLDDIAKNKTADYYTTFNMGISYALTWQEDTDNDGVPDNWDKCPFSPVDVEVDDFGCPVDKDEDGVPDYRDNCLDTPFGVDVDQLGCPVDQDKDGVPDYKDLCASTPRVAEVDENGCPVDSDKDGVPDYKDLCPDTEAGSNVDSSGCYILDEKSNFLESVIIYFHSGTAEINDSETKKLNKLVHFMISYPEIKWYIEGHQDNVESSGNEEELSIIRAKNVVEYFLRKGVNSNSLNAVDRGKNFAISDNNTIDGREKNRRVVIFGIK